MIQSLTASIDVSTEEISLPAPLLNALRKICPGTWRMQLRSLNQRFFELNCMVPDFAPELEVPLRKLLQKSLLRGRIECRLSYTPEMLTRQAHDKESGNGAEGSRSACRFDYQLLCVELRQLHDLQRLAKDFGMDLPRPSSLELLQHCRYLQQQENTAAGDPRQIEAKQLGTKRDGDGSAAAPNWQQAVLEFSRQVCQRLIVARQVEGLDLYRELLQLHHGFVAQCQRAQGLEAEIPGHYRRQLLDKLGQLQEAFTDADREPQIASDNREACKEGLRWPGEERLLAELSLFLAKGDVREELSRLRIHAERFFTVLQGAHEAGAKQLDGAVAETELALPLQSEASCCAKELDFLLQEMNREANTLGSKSPLVELQQVAVQLKVIIEQMREQVKNVL